MKLHPARWFVGGLVTVGWAGTLAVSLMRRKGLSGKAPLPTLLVGDSMGVGLTSPLRMAGMPIHSIAIEGKTVDYWVNQGLPTLQHELASKPGGVLVVLGTNDAYAGDAYAPTAAAAAQKLLAAIEAAGALTFWIGPPKLPASYGGHAPSQAVLDAIRNAVDTFPPGAFWIESGDLTIPRSPDQLHPTGAGYAYWSDLIVDRVGLSFVAPSAADTVQGDTFGAELPPPPTPIVVPQGWKHLKDSLTTPAMVSFAVSVLFRKLPIDDLQVSIIEGKKLGAWTTWHYDDHVGHVLKWHRGISLLTPEGTS